MKKRTKRLLGGIALAAGGIAAAGAFLRRRNVPAKRSTKKPVDVWARPGMQVTFRAELMPGRERDDRSFRVKELLPSGRVLLHGVDGEHAEKEFERIQ